MEENMLIIQLQEAYGVELYNNTSVFAGNLLPGEQVVVPEIPEGVEFKPQWFGYDSTYGITPLKDFDHELYMVEKKLTQEFQVPEFKELTFKDKILGNKTITEEKFLAELPKLKFFWFNKDYKKWIPHYKQIWWLPTYQIK